MGHVPNADSSHPPKPFVKWLPVGLTLVLFSPILVNWFRFSLGSDLYSYTILVPVISAYFARTSKPTGKGRGGGLDLVSILLLGAGAVLGIAYVYLLNQASAQIQQDRVSLGALAFVFTFVGAAWLTVSAEDRSRLLFPLAFLIFMAPMPLALEHRVETLLQYGSAPPAYWMFKLAGTPVFKQDLVFQLPGMTLQIAPECSGIRSTLVLFMTSIVAGQLFLRSAWRRTVLALVVIPLALVRNGFRVFVIGELCVHVGPHMIDSPIHHQGGPIFFALSLIPFSLLVYFLVKTDRAARAKPPVTA